MNPQVSIIIPVYNVEKYVYECLNSVIEQSCQSELECILVDDCGKDNSVSMVEDFIQKYDGSIPFKLLHHEHNEGLSAARNTAIKKARGEYVCFLDSDDKLYPNSISNLLMVAKKYPEAEMILGSMTNGYVLSKKDKPDYSTDVEWIRKGLCTIEIPDSACNKLVKREFILAHKLFFAEGYLQEDTIWSYQVQKHIASIAFCFKDTYWYRYNPNGIMNGMGLEREAKSYARVFNYVFNDMVKCDKIEPYEIKYLIWNAKRVFNYIGKQEGNKLLVTQNNPIFNKVLKWSTGLSRIHIAFIRTFLLWCIKVLIYDPTIKKLCNKQNLLKNYTDIDYSQPI